MKITTSQTQILDVARSNGGTITTKQAIETIGSRYYHNQAKHTGEVLTRMVKAGLLKRVKVGDYQISTPQKAKGKRCSQNQSSLFDFEQL